MNDMTPPDRLSPSASESLRPAEHETGAFPRGRDNLKDHLVVLRRHRWLVLMIVAVSVGISVYRVTTEEQQYRARAVVHLTEDRQALTSGIGDAGERSPTAGDRVQAQLQILRSRNLAGEVVDAEGLRVQILSRAFPWELLRDVEVAPDATGDTLRVDFTSHGVVVRGRTHEAQAGYGEPVELNGVRFTVAREPATEVATLLLVSRDRAIDRLMGTFHARARDRTTVMDLEYTTSDPFLAQRVVNAWAHAYGAHSVRTARERSQRRRVFIEEQLLQTEAMLDESQLVLNQFRSREAVYRSSDRFSAQQSELIGLGVRREELGAERGMYQRVLEQLQEAQGRGGHELSALVSSIGIGTNPAVAQLYGQLAGYHTERDRLTKGDRAVTLSHPEVQGLDALIAETEQRVVNGIRSHVAMVDARLSALDELRARSSAEIRSLPQSEAEEVRLVRQLDTYLQSADRLRGELQGARIAEAVEAGQVEIVDLAVGGGPLPGGGARSVAFGLLVGLLLGVGGAFFRDHLITSINTRGEMESALGIPGLALIPRIPSMPNLLRGIALRLPNRKGRRPGKTGTRKAGWWRSSEADLDQTLSGLVTISDPRSNAAEAYRTLRTNLIFSPGGKNIRMLVVASALPSEGKTTIAANLAVSFARQGLRVLLVDCDLRRPRIHKLFGIPREPGFSQLMLGQCGRGEAIQSTSVGGLQVLACGTQLPNPAELMGISKTPAILASLAKDYDLVLVDTPPLLAAADASILAAMSDGVLLVVRAGSTDRAVALQAHQQLTAVGARIVGAVLNDPDARAPGYGEYSYAYENGPYFTQVA